MSKPTLIKLSTIAAELNVDRSTVYKWIERGLIKSTQLPTGTIRIAQEDYQAFKSMKNVSPPVKILVIDDQPGVIENIKLQLETIDSFKHEIRSCCSGLGGLLDIGAFQPDLILMDYRLQDSDGLVLANQIFENKRFATIPIIIISGVIHNLEDQTYHQNIRGFLQKPFTASSLEQMLLTCLRQEGKIAA